MLILPNIKLMLQKCFFRIQRNDLRSMHNFMTLLLLIARFLFKVSKCLIMPFVTCVAVCRCYLKKLSIEHEFIDNKEDIDFLNNKQHKKSPKIVIASTNQDRTPQFSKYSFRMMYVRASVQKTSMERFLIFHTNMNRYFSISTLSTKSYT